MLDFQMAWHDNPYTYPEWGSAPRGPLIRCDGAHQGELMASVIGPDVVTGQPMVYHIVRCELCIVTHVWPLPDPTALQRYYETTFYQQDKPDYLARTARDLPWWTDCVWTPLLRRCAREARWRYHDPFQPLRLLDVGAGPAVSLDVARRMSMQTYGIEPNEQVCDLAAQRGHIMHCGTLDTFHSTQRFHVITAYEVLEHHVCPDEFILKCWDLLEPGGILMVQVPNDFNPLQLEACRRFALPRWWIAPPQHLQYFSPKTLQLCVRRCGFQICEMRGTYPLERFMLDDGMMYIGNSVLGRTIHKRRMAQEMGEREAGRWDDLEAVYRGNITQRIGREIVCIARKEG